MNTLVPDGFDILLEDGPAMFVQKPGGLATQAPPNVDSLEVRIKRFIKVRENKPGNVYLAVPHRLDRPVSGVMVFAKHVRAAKRISRQFENRLVQKTYWACVSGLVEEDRGTWVDYLRKIPGKAKSEIVSESHSEGKKAVLHFEVMKRSASKTWLQIQLETGRTHQIRLQLSSRSFPILGDNLYGSNEQFGPVTEDERAKWIALHARRISLRHPMHDEMQSVEAPLPIYWHTAGISHDS